MRNNSIKQGTHWPFTKEREPHSIDVRVVCSARAAVAAWLHQEYCRGAAFAQLPSEVDNPDQRMAADVGRWAEELGRLSMVFAAAPLKACL